MQIVMRWATITLSRFTGRRSPRRLGPNGIPLLGRLRHNIETGNFGMTSISLVKKNYSLTELDEGISAHDTTGEVGTLLRLNQAGRRYLINDAASVAKGVEVLIGVSYDLGCLFYHLLGNPTLCDIEHQYNTKSGTDVHLNKRQRI
jgi:hypothetical protein